MTGNVKKLIDMIIEQRAKGDSLIVEITKTKMLMKGINPELHTTSTKDDEKVIGKLKQLAKEWGLHV